MSHGGRGRQDLLAEMGKGKLASGGSAVPRNSRMRTVGGAADRYPDFPKDEHLMGKGEGRADGLLGKDHVAGEKQTS